MINQTLKAVVDLIEGIKKEKPQDDVNYLYGWLDACNEIQLAIKEAMKDDEK